MDVQLDREGPPILDQFSEVGFVDLTFRLSILVDDVQHEAQGAQLASERVEFSVGGFQLSCP